MKAKIRKIMTVVDETLTEQEKQVSPPIRRAAAIAVIANPFAGKKGRVNAEPARLDASPTSG